MQALLSKFHLEARSLAACEPELEWDYWNAMLYCWTVVTTIGYGHLYPTTAAGKIATMLYALVGATPAVHLQVGIPLMLMILTDLGKLLTKLMKLPWFVTKLVFRRAFRSVGSRAPADHLQVVSA